MGQLHVVVDVQPGAGGDQLADDDVLLEASEGVDLALDGGVGEVFWNILSIFALGL